MVNVKINGLDMRFTMGTLMLISAMNPGSSPLSPLEKLPESDHGAIILYGALAAYDEKHDKAPSYSLQDCHKLIKDFTTTQYVAMVNAYNNLMNLDSDQDVSKSTDEESEEDKKK